MNSAAPRPAPSPVREGLTNPLSGRASTKREVCRVRPPPESLAPTHRNHEQPTPPYIALPGSTRPHGGAARTAPPRVPRVARRSRAKRRLRAPSHQRNLARTPSVVPGRVDHLANPEAADSSKAPRTARSRAQSEPREDFHRSSSSKRPTEPRRAHLLNDADPVVRPLLSPAGALRSPSTGRVRNGHQRAARREQVGEFS